MKLNLLIYVISQSCNSGTVSLITIFKYVLESLKQFIITLFYQVYDITLFQKLIFTIFYNFRSSRGHLHARRLMFCQIDNQGVMRKLNFDIHLLSEYPS